MGAGARRLEYQEERMSRSCTRSRPGGPAAGARCRCWCATRASCPSRVDRGLRRAARSADRAFEPADPVELAEAVRIERWLDADLGPHTRRWTYSEMRDERELARAYNLTGVPDSERALFPRPLPAAVRGGQARARRDAGDDGRLQAPRARGVRRGGRAARRWAAVPRRRALLARDFSFAALAAPVLMPDQYGIPLPKLHELPAAWAEDIAGLRAHPRGTFALRMFADYR